MLSTSGTAGLRAVPNPDGFFSFDRLPQMHSPLIARSSLAALLLALSLTGCSVLRRESEEAGKPAQPPQKKRPAGAKKRPAKPDGKTEALPHAPVDDGALAPVFRPSIADAPKLTLDQQIRIRFHEKALRSGAPKSVTVLRALVVSDPGLLRAAFTAMGMNVWAITWNQKGVEESRSPRLPAEVKADRFIRDFAFAFWPAESVKKSIPSELDLIVTNRGDAEIRALIRNQAPILRAVITRTQGRTLITIMNAPEGYTLDIEAAR